MNKLRFRGREPLVSILIPAYNTEQWIAGCIASALAQTWPRKEIIVVDDGSKDHTLSISRQFASQEVCVVTQPNQGAAAARNKALSIAQGDYIQWLDADDLLSHDKVERQMAVAEECGSTRTLLSSSWAHFMFRTSKARFTPTPLWADLSPVEWLLRKWEGNDHMQTATWLVSRELSEAAGLWDTRLLSNDDGEYFFRVIRACEQIRFVASARVYYRMTTGNRLSYIGRSNRKMDLQFFGMQLQIGYLRSMQDDARARAACVKFLQTWLHNFYPNRPDIVKQAQQLARALGGELNPPRLSWKYGWIQKLFGWNAAKNARLRYNECKSSFLTTWDRALFLWERRTRRALPEKTLL